MHGAVANMCTALDSSNTSTRLASNSITALPGSGRLAHLLVVLAGTSRASLSVQRSPPGRASSRLNTPPAWHGAGGDARSQSALGRMLTGAFGSDQP